MARPLTGKHLAPCFSCFKGKSRGEMQGRGEGAVIGLGIIGVMDGTGRKTGFGAEAAIHGGLLSMIEP